MPIQRVHENPILTPADFTPSRGDMEVFCTLNPAAVRMGDEIILLVRVGERPIQNDRQVRTVHYNSLTDSMVITAIDRNDPDLDTSDARGFTYQGKMLLTSISSLYIARSRDGVHFNVDHYPAIRPDNEYEKYGCEDARIACIDDIYYITYTAVSDRGVAVALATTTGFKRFQKHGLIFPPYNKDVVLFPEKINGQYVARHRPWRSEFNPASIWTAWSPDLFHWGGHSMTLPPTPKTWESQRVGAGATPILTDQGWLEIYHACDDQGCYRLGVMLSERENPENIISRSQAPVFEPEWNYERTGVWGNVVFTNGIVVQDNGVMHMYYGAGDTVCAIASTTIEAMISAAKNETAQQIPIL